MAYGRDIALAFIGGILTALLIVMAAAFTFMRKSDVYGLGHWKLNAKMPLATMWMNLGYWTDAEGERIKVFEQACSNLLREILSVAGLLHDSSSTQRRSHKSLAILDLGFGCGEQTWELVRLTSSGGWEDFRYVGLTLEESQVQAATRKVYREIQAASSSSEGQEHAWKPTADRFGLFRADAGRPDTWQPRTNAAVGALADEKMTDRWLLALDCLYHFNPSRKPVFEYAARHMDANIMAFDLVLNEKASFRDAWTARAVGVMMGCPARTFLTEAEYRDQLIGCGYDRRCIEIRDISDHVFAGVVEFLKDQERALSEYGTSLGGYKLAGRLFEWFGRSQAVKAVIVVARTKGKST